MSLRDAFKQVNYLRADAETRVLQLVEERGELQKKLRAIELLLPTAITLHDSARAAAASLMLDLGVSQFDCTTRLQGLSS